MQDVCAVILTLDHMFAAQCLILLPLLLLASLLSGPQLCSDRRVLIMAGACKVSQLIQSWCNQHICSRHDLYAPHELTKSHTF